MNSSHWRWAATVLLPALVSAGLYAALLPPLSWTLLAWIALVPLLVGATLTRPGWATLMGSVFGYAIAWAVYWWFPGMLIDFFRLTPVHAWALSLAAGVIVAAPYACFAAWLSWLVGRASISPLMVAGGWIAIEYLSAVGPLTNPLGFLAHTLVTTPLAQTADLVGQYGVAVPVVAFNALLAGVFAPQLRGRSTARSVALVALLVAAAFSYSAWRLHQPPGEGEPVEVAIIQGAIEHDFFLEPDERAESATRYLELTKSLGNDPVDLVFWPEWGSNVNLADLERHGHSLFLEDGFEFDLILGAPYRRETTTGRIDHNSVFLLRKGQILGRYDKTRLMPFAEYDPLHKLRRWPRRRYSPGKHFRTLPSLGGRVGVMICSEVAVPAVARRLLGDGAEILANPSNDYWLGHPVPAKMQLQVAMMRAIENRRYLVRPTSTGYSAVIDPRGKPLAIGPWGGEAILTATIFRSHTRTLYGIWGDIPAILVLGFCLLLPVLRYRSRSHGRSSQFG